MRALTAIALWVLLVATAALRPHVHAVGSQEPSACLACQLHTDPALVAVDLSAPMRLQRAEVVEPVPAQPAVAASCLRFAPKHGPPAA